MANVTERNNVHVRGAGDRAMVFAHGFGCDQNMWRFVAPAFERDFRTVLLDHVGAGGSDLSAYDWAKYSTLSDYADDVVEIGAELGLKDCVFVGHSVSSMIGVLAARRPPGMFGKLVLIGPSACYIDDEGHVGGFSAEQIDELLALLHMGWSTQIAPMIMGNPDRPELGQELTNSFCRTDPDIAKAVRPCDFHFRQSQGSRGGFRSSPRPSMQEDITRLPGGRRVRCPQYSRRPDDRA